LGDILGQGIHRHDALDVDGGFLAGFNLLRFGMAHRARFERGGFAIDHQFVADRKVSLHILGIPP